jgi:hypothetical protein
MKTSLIFLILFSLFLQQQLMHLNQSFQMIVS